MIAHLLTWFGIAISIPIGIVFGLAVLGGTLIFLRMIVHAITGRDEWD